MVLWFHRNIILCVCGGGGVLIVQVKYLDPFLWWGPFFSKGVQIFQAQVEVFVPGVHKLRSICSGGGGGSKFIMTGHYSYTIPYRMTTHNHG